MPSSKGAEGKARQRARITQYSADQAVVRRMATRAWEDVADDLSWVCDFEGGVQQVQMTPNTAILTLHIPLSYINKVVEMGQAMSPTIFLRAYIPPPPPGFNMEIDGEDDAEQD